MATEPGFTKIIWFAWFQGLDQAPEIVKICYESWVRKNPDWDVRFYDLGMVEGFLQSRTGSCFHEVPMQQKSDIFRINILKEYGGVWADATTLCVEPLNNWLDGCLNSGFFAFKNPSCNKVLSSWFLASQYGCPLTEKFCREHTKFWLENLFPDQNTMIRSKLKSLLHSYTRKSVDRTDLWLTPFVTKSLGIYPYTIFHYQFARFLKRDVESRRIFSETVFKSAIPAQQLRRCRQAGMSIEETRRILSSNTSPIYKLSWKEKLYPQNGVPHREYIRGIGL